MGVVEERQGNEAELTRAWVEGRARVLRAVARSFPTVGSVMVEAAVDQAWVELYEQGCDGPPESWLARWRELAYLRALNGVRGRRRHFIDSVTLEELDAADVLSESDTAAMADAASQAEARAQEIVRQVSGDAQRWLEVVIDAPGAPPREVARTLGWDREKLKTVAWRTRARLREFVAARASGAICERRQAVMDAFAATQLVRRDPALAVRLEERSTLGSELYEQVALHIAGCEECERAWRKAQNRLLRPRLVFFPAVFTGKLAGVGGSAIAAGRRALGRLDRLFWDLRIRVGSSVGRATAGGAAGTAGTAGALAGKGAAVCVGVLCATGMGTAALVGLPAGIIASRTVSHHHHHKIVVRRSDAAAAARARSTVAVSNGQTASTQGDMLAARAGKNAQRASAAHTISRSARPVTPGSLVATSSATNTNEAASQPSARAASTPDSASGSEVSTEYVPSATSSSSQSSSSSADKHGPCVPGSLSC